MCSRPRRSPATKPASASTRRCLVMACRETADFTLIRAIDSGPLVDSRISSCSRVASPSAANSGAASCARRAASGDMGGDVAELFGPAALVHAERLVLAFRRQLVEAGLDDGQQRAAVLGLQ